MGSTEGIWKSGQIGSRPPTENTSFWVPQKVAFRKGNPLISGKWRLVNIKKWNRMVLMTRKRSQVIRLEYIIWLSESVCLRLVGESFIWKLLLLDAFFPGIILYLLMAGKMPFDNSIYQEDKAEAKGSGHSKASVSNPDLLGPEKIQVMIDLYAYSECIGSFRYHFVKTPMPHLAKRKMRWWQLKYFWNFYPDPWGFMIQFDEHIFEMGC